MRVLVTGGAGFIGSHISDALVADGHDVVVVDTTGPCPRGARYFDGNILDGQAWVANLAHVDAVCHQAAKVGIGPADDITSFVNNNAVGLAVGLEAIVRTGWAGRFVLASSVTVYGEGLDVDEHDRLDPRSVYAATKLHQEHLASAVGQRVGFPVTSLRYHNVYGARMPVDTPYTGVAPIWRSSILRGEPPRVFEDGLQQRDFVHVSDVARANVLALTAPTPYDGPLNVASGDPHPIIDVARMLSAALNGPEPVITGERRAGDVRHITASPKRAIEAIGFEAQVSLADGLVDL